MTFPDRFWRYYQITNLNKPLPVGAELFHADGQAATLKYTRHIFYKYFCTSHSLLDLFDNRHTFVYKTWSYHSGIADQSSGDATKLYPLIRVPFDVSEESHCRHFQRRAAYTSCSASPWIWRHFYFCFGWEHFIKSVSMQKVKIFSQLLSLHVASVMYLSAFCVFWLSLHYSLINGARCW
jgi:hypothetical protein